MAGPIITHHVQGSAAAIAGIGSKLKTALYYPTTGDARVVRVTRFDVMDQATYTALADKSPTTLYIIHPTARGARTSHRWPSVAATATAFYLGDVATTPAFGDTKLT